MPTSLILKHTGIFIGLLATYSLCPAQRAPGVFDGQSDVGAVMKKGNAIYNPKKQEYSISGAGANIWFDHDEFQYAWKKIQGDFILQARARFLGKGLDPHRKLGWMIRTSLDSNAAMVTATVHGDGLTSLQYRKSKAANVEEKKSVLVAPAVLQLQRKGNSYIMSVAIDGQPLQSDSITFNLPSQVYAGLFVCSHNKDVVETAIFDNVRVIVPAKETFVPYREYIGSHIEVMDIQSGHREMIYSDPGSMQAPNWMKDGKSLIYNQKGLIYRLDLARPVPQVINTDFVKNNNNDHVLSFDGKMLGLSGTNGEPGQGSQVFTVPIKGGVPKRITEKSPSYLHSWSPDGKHLIYTAQRNNEWDIYRIPSTGGEELRLTSAPGLDDGSEYTPDGKFIYFNSLRAGNMQIWRMNADGSDPQQVTFDKYNNWFPHISPNGKTIVFLSFPEDVKADEHPFYKHVYLRSIPIEGGTPKIVAYVYGGQGTINTPSWSPDSRKIAFVSNSDQPKTW